MGIERLSVNMTPAERIARVVVLGPAGVVAAALLLQNAGLGLAASLEVLLGLAGLDLVVTGATGHCPPYRRLGHAPASWKGRDVMNATPGSNRRAVHWHDETSARTPTSEGMPHQPEGRPSDESHGHGLMMLVCCIPMLLIVIALVATGAAGAGATASALCAWP